MFRNVMYYQTALPVAFLKQLLVSFFFSIGKPQDPAAACLIFIVVAAVGVERCTLNVDQVSSSLIGLWISPYF